MYLPTKFKQENLAVILQLIQNYPFATLITPGDNLTISHLPLVSETDGKHITLYGHFARQNNQSKVSDQKNITVIFHGPHTYINPHWYMKNNVPTWNYAAIHLQGVLILEESLEKTLDGLKKLTQLVKHYDANPWDFWVPTDLQNPDVLMNSIIGFKIIVDKVEAKYKLSQNRSHEDVEGVKKGLAGRSDEMSQAVLNLMNSF